MLKDNDCVVIGTVAAPRYGHVVPLAETVKENRRVNVYHIRNQLVMKYVPNLRKTFCSACSAQVLPEVSRGAELRQLV